MNKKGFTLIELFRFPNDKKLELNNNPKNGYSRVINGNLYEIAIDDGKYCTYKDQDEITVIKLNGKTCDSYINNETTMKSYYDTAKNCN